jgi:hypothetical protein
MGPSKTRARDREVGELDTARAGSQLAGNGPTRLGPWARPREYDERGFPRSQRPISFEARVRRLLSLDEPR